MMHVIVILFFSFFAVAIYGSVQILETTQPLYLLEGDKLTLTCQGPQNSRLMWLSATPNNGWSDVVVNATTQARTVLRYTYEQPSGNEEYEIIISTMTKADRGTYTCQNGIGTSSVAMWVVVLDIQKHIIPSVGTGPVTLQCNVTGFDTNVPNMAYSWSFQNVPLSSTSGNKYSVTYRSGSSSLTIMQPGRSDVGNYTCSFGLATTTGITSFQLNIPVDSNGISNLSSSGVSTISLIYSHVIYLVIGLIVSMLYD